MSDTAPSTPANILARIRKLHAMTTANGCTESEAQIAFQKLTELMGAYNIFQADLRTTPDSAFVKDAWSFFGPTEWTRCALAIEDHFQVKFWLSSQATPLGTANKLCCFGTAPNVAAALMLAEVCYLAMATAGEAYMKGSKAGKHLPSFHIGMAKRLNQRIRELTTNSPGQQLVLSQKAQVHAAWLQSPYGFKSRRALASRPLDPKALGAGSIAANSVRLGVSKEVGGQARIAGR